MYPRALITLALVLCLLAAHTIAQEDSTNEGNRSPLSGGLFNFIWRPIRSTFEQAKRLIVHPLDSVNDGIDSVRSQSFEIFMRLYNKTYSPEEIPRRMELFFSRRKQIEESVKSFREGKSLFAMSENPYLDWDDDELKMLTGVSIPNESELLPEEQHVENELKEMTPVNGSVRVTRSIEDNLIVKAPERIPAAKDWRTSGCISTPMNQGKCGACYAIATMSVVESMHCLSKVSSPILSPQQIVDCSTVRAGYKNYGCDGGWPTRVLKYLQDHRIVSRESCYPFVRRQNACKLSTAKSTEGCTLAASFKSNRVQYKVLTNEQDILYHVANTGPVITVMQASDKFVYYGKGIFDDPKCSRRRDDVDHAIVIVGYGRRSGVDYWIIKNSWGTSEWGEGGYGLYRRVKNACSIGHWGWVVTG